VPCGQAEDLLGRCPRTCRAVSSSAGLLCSGSSCKDQQVHRDQWAPGQACLPPPGSACASRGLLSVHGDRPDSPAQAQPHVCGRGKPRATHPGAGAGGRAVPGVRMVTRVPGLRCGNFSTRLVASWRARTQPGNLIKPEATTPEEWCSPATWSAGGSLDSGHRIREEERHPGLASAI